MGILAQVGTNGSVGNPLPDETLTFTFDQVLSPYMWVFLAAFAVAFIATPIMRKLALANGIVDWPDLKRKAHVEPVAYLGGVAIFLGWFMGVFVSSFLLPHSHSAADMATSVNFPMSIIFGGIIITMVGLIDDVYGISPRVKIGGQLFAAALLAHETVGTELVAGIIASTFSILGISTSIIPGFGSEIQYLDPSYWLGALFVTVLVLGGCNSLNLIDGLDGLASGLTGIAAIFLGVIALVLAMGLYGLGGAYSPGAYDPVRIVMCLAILGAVVGFLPYNFNPANIFMGDCGSLLLGYLLVTVVLLLAEKGDPAIVMAGLIVIAVPMLDTLLAIVRRKMQGKPIFSPDNQHLHHQLRRAGYSVKKAVLLLYGASVVFGVIGASLTFLRLRYAGSIFIVLFGFVIVMAYKVGHRQHLAMLEAEQKTAAGEATDADANEPAEAPDADHVAKTATVKPDDTPAPSPHVPHAT